VVDLFNNSLPGTNSLDYLCNLEVFAKEVCFSLACYHFNSLQLHFNLDWNCSKLNWNTELWR